MYVDVQTAGGKSRKDKMGPKIYEVAFINCHSQIKYLVRDIFVSSCQFLKLLRNSLFLNGSYSLLPYVFDLLAMPTMKLSSDQNAWSGRPVYEVKCLCSRGQD